MRHQQRLAGAARSAGRTWVLAAVLLLASVAIVSGPSAAEEPPDAASRRCVRTFTATCEGLDAAPPAMAEYVDRLLRAAGYEIVAEGAGDRVSVALRGKIASTDTGFYEDTGEVHLFVRVVLQGELSLERAGTRTKTDLSGETHTHDETYEIGQLLPGAYASALANTGLVHRLGELLLPEPARLAYYVKVLETEHDYSSQQSAVAAVRALPERRGAVAALIGAYRRNSFLQPVVADLLTEIGGEEVVTFFVETLRTEKHDAADNAARALAKIGGERAASAVVTEYLERDHYTSREVLDRFGEEAEPMLLAGLQSPDPSVRARAAWGLGDVRALSAVEPILALLQGPAEPDAMVIGALTELQDPRAIPPILALARSSERLRYVCFRALGRLEAWEAVPLLLEHVGRKDWDADGARHGLVALAGDGKDWDLDGWRAWWRTMEARGPVVAAPPGLDVVEAGTPERPLKLELVRVPPGRYVRGGGEGEGWVGREPRHEVTLSKGFTLGRTEVTQALYAEIVGTNPSRVKGDDLPVDSVSFDDAVLFCEKLSKRTGRRFRLPTEAEWEYACRAGTTSPVFYGRERRGDFAWFAGNAGRRPHAVGTRRPNPWGFHDLYGNVAEWCSDGLADYPKGPVVDPPGDPEGKLRIVRGGSFESTLLRSTHRDAERVDTASPRVGFRVAASLD